MPPQSAASAAYGGDGLQAGAHRAPAGRDRVGAILHTEGVAVVPYGLRTSHVVTWESVASRNNGSARRTRPALQRRVWRHGSQLSCAASGVNHVDSHCGLLYPYNGYGSREDAVVESASGRCGCGVGAAVR